MQKHLRTERHSVPQPTGLHPTYRPALDGHAQSLIARIQHDNQDTAAVLELAAHYEAHADHPSLANLFEGWAQTLQDDRTAADAYVHAAEAVLLGLDDWARVERLFGSALERCPEHEHALSRFETLLRERGDDTGVERCLSQIVNDLKKRNADPTLRAATHFRLGQLYEERLLLRGRAIAEYRSAVELDATLVPAIAAARGIYLNSGKVDAAADMFELQIAATPDTTSRHALLIGLSKHRRHVLGDLDGAILVLRRAIKTLPSEPTTFEMLAEMLAVRSRRKDNDHRAADRERAAELYYQVARSLPRELAQPRLDACLKLQPGHVRASVFLDEVLREKAAAEEPSAPGEWMAVMAHSPASRLTSGHTLPGFGTLAETRRAPSDEAKANVEEEVAAWLDDSDVTLLEDGVTTQRMIPLSDRPPTAAATPVLRIPKSRLPN